VDLYSASSRTRLRCANASRKSALISVSQSFQPSTSTTLRDHGYSAFIVASHTQGAGAWITQFYLQITPYLPLPRNRSQDGATTDWSGKHL